MIRIRNKKTGEVKEIEESQLGSFGLAPKVDPTATPEKVTEPSTKITVDQLYKMSLDPKIKPATYTKIKQLYDLQQEEVKNSGKGAPTTVEGQKTEGLVNSGIRALATVQSEYQRDPSLTLKQKVPGKFFSRKFDSALFNSVDTLLRLRTGATAPPSEVRNYMRSFGPVFGDSPEDVQFKLNQLQADLLDAAGRKDEFKPLTIKVAEGKKTTPLGQFGEVFAPGVTKSIDIVKNIPEATRVASEEMGQKGLLGAPSPKLRKLVGGTGEETGNRFMNAFKDSQEIQKTESQAVAEVGAVLQTAGGIKKLFSGGTKTLSPIVKNAEERIAEAATADAEGVAFKNTDILKKVVAKIKRDRSLGGKDKLKAIEFAKSNFSKKGSVSVQESVGDFMKSDAFTKGGTRVKGPKGLYNLSVRDVYKELWQKQAPEVLKRTQDMAKWFALQRKAKAAKGTLMGIAGAAGGAAYLMSLAKGGGGGGYGGSE